MSKRIAEILMIFSFSVFLIWAMIGTIQGSDKTVSYYENRNLAKMPSLTETSLMSGKYYKKMESFLTDHAAARKSMVFIKTEMDLDLFHRPVVNDVVVKDHLLLSYCEFGEKDENDLPGEVRKITKNLRTVSETAASYGGYFCYVAIPPQFYCYSDQYPWYLENWSDYTEEQIRQLSSSLKKADVNFMDMGPILEEEGVLQSESSRVDNHYSIYGAFETYKAVMQRINEDTDDDLDILSDEDVTITKVKNSYLGSYERKLLSLKNMNESLFRLDLNDPVDFAQQNNGVDCVANVYDEPKSRSRRVTYNYYMGGDQGETIIDTKRPRLPSILIYGDSFTNALECILYNSFDKMYSLDLRHYDESTISEYIEEYEPDYVICVRDYEALTDAEYNGGK